MDLTTCKTYDIEGNKNIMVSATKGAKQRITFLTAICSSGDILPIYAVFQNKKFIDISDKLKPFAIVRQNNSGWINNDLFIDWLKRIPYETF